MTQRLLILVGLIISTPIGGQEQTPARQPIIDMHIHVSSAADPRWRGRFDGVAGLTPDAVLRRETIAELDRHDVVRARASGPMPYAEQWREAMNDRVRVSPLFPCPNGRVPNGGGIQCFASGSPWPDVAWLRGELASGRVRVIGELGYSYFGIPPTDDRMEPYFALAEEFDVPVAVHTGLGPPPEHLRGCCPDYRGEYGNPALLEKVLGRHSKLRLYLMHAGYPYLDETVALMRNHPGVYTDFSMLGVVLPPEEFHRYLKSLVDAGFAKRLLFGSDSPLQIGRNIAVVDSVPFLTPTQKRDILYNNAARFLRLTSEEIATHHRR